MEVNKAKNQHVEISVVLLDHSEIIFKVNKRERGQVLLDNVFEHLKCQEPKYYGLQFPQDVPDSMRWLDPSKSIRKQFKRGYPLILYYRIKYYIRDLSHMRDDYTRYQLFLQVKLDLLERRLECPEKTAALLASYSAQSELGDYHPKKHAERYLSKHRLLPIQTEEFEEEVQCLHKMHKGMSPADAEKLYLQEANRINRYGVDIHYGKNANGEDLEVGVSIDGISLFKERSSDCKYDWSKITKISFKRKQFCIQLQKDKQQDDDTDILFYMDNYRACKRLWKNCVDCHSFHRQDKEKYKNTKQNNISGTIKSDKPIFGFFTLGGRNHKAAVDHKENTSQFRQKSNSTKMLNATNSPFAKGKDYSEEELKGSRRLSAPPSVTMAVVLPDQSSTPNSARHRDHVLANYKSSQGLMNRSDVSLSTHDKSQASANSIQESYYDSPFPPLQDTTNGGSPLNATEQYKLPEDLVLIRLKPDKEGRFGFNIKGGSDQNMPIIVSKIAPKSPADICMPRLNVGDEVLQINGRDACTHSHDQAVRFIRATREQHSGELVLLVRPPVVYQICDENEQSFEIDAVVDGPKPENGQVLCTQDSLALSMSRLENLLDTGNVMLAFDKLYRKNASMSIAEAKLPCNSPRNRYRDISPYDLTRVRLRDWETEYINASHIIMKINNTEILNRYIASQGPLRNTSGDFWAMVWQQQSTLLIMVTTTVERGMVKCFQYWPDLGCSVQFNNIIVQSVSEELTPCFAFREFEITFLNEDDTSETRKVTHMQYLAWPDHGVPDDSSDFLDFVLRVRQKRVGMTAPAIVHCSAGIGRTGVMISMETSMCLIEANQPVNPLQITMDMRDQRAMMIQTAGQFKFVCEAIIRVYKDELAKPNKAKVFQFDNVSST